MRTTRVWTVLGALILSFGLLAGCDKDEKKAVCGNGILEGDEECDGAQFRAGLSCEGEGFYAGILSCSNDCGINTLTCHNCGDGVLDEGEECDGADLGDLTCETEGYDLGELACTASCHLDETGCDFIACFEAEFTSVDATAMTDGNHEYYYYEEIVEDSGLYFIVEVELIDYADGLEIGDHALGVGNEALYWDCYYCFGLWECLDSACSDVGSYYFATAGTMGLDSLGAVGETISGDLDSVTLVEWDINEEVDAPLADGECIELPAWSFESDLAQAVFR